MFKIGDKVVYPMHGAGIIEKIEERKILDSTREYYIMKIPFGDMKVMIPVDNTAEIGVRSIVTEAEIETVMEALRHEVTQMPDNWNKRYRENLTKLKSGDILKVTDVVRNLMVSEHEKGLSTGERKMLLNAKQILVSEIVLVKEIDIDEAESQVAEAVFGQTVKE